MQVPAITHFCHAHPVWSCPVEMINKHKCQKVKRCRAACSFFSPQKPTTIQKNPSYLEPVFPWRYMKTGLPSLRAFWYHAGSLPCASFISRALMCLSTWVCAFGRCFWVFVYCYLIKDRLPCRFILSEHCNWKQHTVIVADNLMQVPSNFDVISTRLSQIVPFWVTVDWHLWMKTVCIENIGICGHYQCLLK